MFDVKDFFTGRYPLPVNFKRCSAMQTGMLTSETLTTFTGETVELVNAGAGILTRVRKTVVTVQITVLTRPSRLTITPISATHEPEKFQ